MDTLNLEQISAASAPALQADASPPPFPPCNLHVALVFVHTPKVSVAKGLQTERVSSHRRLTKGSTGGVETATVSHLDKLGFMFFLCKSSCI